MLVIPRTKQIASRIFDFPLPFRPVIELKLSSLQIVSIFPREIVLVAIVYHPEMTVRTAYDLKPCNEE